MSDLESDRKLIADLGGPTRVAELMGWPRAGGPQRVQNWLARGIPAAVRVQRPDLFMPHLAAAAPAPAATASESATHGA